MGQAPATDKISLRTVPRNFPGRSGTREDKVCLVSPETAAASALAGVITDPRSLRMKCPVIREPEKPVLQTDLLQPPIDREEALHVELLKGPNIATLPELAALPDAFELPVILKVRDNVSTDEILPAGARVLPYRSNIPKIAEFAFGMFDDTYPRRALEVRDAGGHIVIAGANYGQGSSREHAALAPRYLGLRAVIARSFARIHWQNLINFGVLPFTFVDPGDYDRIEQGDRLRIDHLEQLADRRRWMVEDLTRGTEFAVSHDLSGRQAQILLAGGLTNWVRESRGRERV
jgi:aconitate hydratase